jgi:hypothetical protein
MHLAAKCQTAFQEWNKLTKEAQGRINIEVMPKIQEHQQHRGLPDPFSQCVRWDILGAVMETTYRACRPPAFFERLLTLYELGRFPCGWKGGEWPNGRLVVI